MAVYVFRVDASLEIGSGHVMRCLTLAGALKVQGAECHFICREHPGNLIEHIRSKGYGVYTLAQAHQAPDGGASVLTVDEGSCEKVHLAHTHWLGVTQHQDADDCAVILRKLQPDWLIVDHYALDARWQAAHKPYYRKLMVIDDLADRSHLCDLLLDQTSGRSSDDYNPWVPSGCTVLCGSQYALLRPEFAALRPYSLRRRESPKLEHLLITMGGVDKDNATGQVLQALASSELPANCQITVVMGATAPWLTEVRQQAEQLPWPTTVRVGVSDMAQLMADSDLAIGAAGATSWERCCLGLPTIMLVLADNQRAIAQALCTAGAALLADSAMLKERRLITRQQMEPRTLSAMSASAATVTDGLGTSQVITFFNRQG
ncbi:UDP-2,4-diacetamido-2,4,6-trideoxy-beta-L-altropyranose hydrolase [Pseudomonas benzenivorans]|uniref:UDP-2,4-diacetamido-2,4, 6-trideoxy-beta-L-altropyranose hydrolase n=1 Tax=Pseudomonas benzenivorans TaxID=556533 RepID=A0ABY5H598_9PSED|nr:UDP-2,4-diacetamido-2,4,6-trideoxy-beta-L-altropyranose hydrolase [Pseudomonas benzenivorans]UTW07486.1 UDP-2,4-diacetamido-2,4,6-trideoxy-beta-L-altropyranose hydrolase [Pseudomonas benzenivorans]